MAYNHPVDPSAQHRESHGRHQAPPIQTQAALRDPRFSYQGTPEPAYYGSPTNSSIDESPLSPVARQDYFPDSHQEAPPSPYPDDKKRGDGIHSPYNLPPPDEIHPAHLPHTRNDGTDVIERRESNAQQHARALSPSEEITSQVPIDDANRRPPTIAHHNYHEPRTPKFDPHSFAGPDAAIASHQPGQAVHANSTVDAAWRNGLCDVDGVCCMGLFCPCVLYGKTQYRLAQKSRKREATDLLEYKACNGSCTLMALACGFQGVLALLQHTRVGRAYKLNTSIKSGCLTSFCCCCCVLMQDEREVKDREEGIKQQQQGLASGAYVSPAIDMTYAPPPR